MMEINLIDGYKIDDRSGSYGLRRVKIMKEGTTGLRKKDVLASAHYRVFYPSKRWDCTDEMVENNKLEALKTLYELARGKKLLKE